MRPLLMLCLLLPAGCALYGGNDPLVSAQAPPNTLSANSEPQPLNSLPLGAANLSPAPGGVHPDFASVTFRAF